MPVPQKVLDQVSEFEKQGYAPADILAGLRASPYKDVAAQIDQFKDKYSDEDILAGLKQSPTSVNVGGAEIQPWERDYPSVAGAVKAARTAIPAVAGAIAGGVAKGATLGMFDPFTGTVGAPFGIGDRYRYSAKTIGEMVSAIAGDTQPAVNISGTVIQPWEQENPVGAGLNEALRLGAEMKGISYPWRATEKVVEGAVNRLGQVLTPAAGTALSKFTNPNWAPGFEAGTQVLKVGQKIIDAATRAGLQTITGGIVGGTMGGLENVFEGMVVGGALGTVSEGLSGAAAVYKTKTLRTLSDTLTDLIYKENNVTPQQARNAANLMTDRVGGLPVRDLKVANLRAKERLLEAEAKAAAEKNAKPDITDVTPEDTIATSGASVEAQLSALIKETKKAERATAPKKVTKREQRLAAKKEAEQAIIAQGEGVVPEADIAAQNIDIVKKMQEQVAPIPVPAAKPPTEVSPPIASVAEQGEGATAVFAADRIGPDALTGKPIMKSPVLQWYDGELRLASTPESQWPIILDPMIKGGTVNPNGPGTLSMEQSFHSAMDVLEDVEGKEVADKARTMMAKKYGIVRPAVFEELEIKKAVGVGPGKVIQGEFKRGGEQSAGSVREDTEQVPGRRDVTKEGKDISGQDLQLKEKRGSEGIQGETEQQAQGLIVPGISSPDVMYHGTNLAGLQGIIERGNFNVKEGLTRNLTESLRDAAKYGRGKAIIGEDKYVVIEVPSGMKGKISLSDINVLEFDKETGEQIRKYNLSKVEKGGDINVAKEEGKGKEGEGQVSREEEVKSIFPDSFWEPKLPSKMTEVDILNEKISNIEEKIDNSENDAEIDRLEKQKAVLESKLAEAEVSEEVAPREYEKSQPGGKTTEEVISYSERPKEEKEIINEYNKKMDSDEWVKAYENEIDMQHFTKEEGYSPLADELIRDLKRDGLKKEASILEIGSGQGRDAEYLAKKGHIVNGIDVSQKAVDVATERTKGLGASFSVGDAEKLEFASNSQDAVYSIAALHGTPIKFTFQEIFRVLKPGGQAKLFLYTRTKTGSKWISYWTPGEIKQYAKEAGFRIEKFREGHDIESIEIPGVEGKIEQETHLVVTTLRKLKTAIVEPRLMSKQDANLVVQQSVSTDTPMKAVRHGRKYAVEPMTSEEITAQAIVPTPKSKKIEAMKKPSSETIDQVTEGLYSSKAEAEDEMLSLGDYAKLYEPTGNDEIGWSVVERGATREAATPDMSKLDAPKTPTYTPMPVSDIAEGLGIQLTDETPPSDVIKALSAQIDNWYLTGEGWKGGEQLAAIRTEVETQVEVSKEYPQWNTKFVELAEKLVKAVEAKAAKDTGGGQMSFMGTGQIIPMIRSLRNWVKGLRETQTFYKKHKMRYNMVGVGPIELNWTNKPDIPGILPVIEHAFLVTSKAFVSYKHYVIDTAKALLHIANDNADTKLFLQETKGNLSDTQIKELTEVGYKIDKFGNRLRNRLYGRNIRAGMDKITARAKAKADARPLIDRYIDRNIQDPAVRDAYDTLRSEFFDPYRKKMQDLMRDKTRKYMSSVPGQELYVGLIDTIKAGAAVQPTLTRAGITSSGDITKFMKAWKKYDRVMEKIDSWGEEDYWSRSMPGNWVLTHDVTSIEGKTKTVTVGVAKTLHAAKAEAISYAIENLVNPDTINVTEKSYNKSRHITDVFVGATLPTRRLMKGLANIFDTAEYYAQGMNKKIYLDPIRWSITKDVPNMPRNVAKHIIDVYNAAKGEYSIIDQITDSAIRELSKGTWMPYKSFSRGVEVGRGAAIRAKLAYRPVSEAINVTDGMIRTLIDVGIGYTAKAEAILHTLVGRQWIIDHKWLLGMKAFEEAGHVTAGTRVFGKMYLGHLNLVSPMGRWQQGELMVRPVNALAAYLKYKDDRMAQLAATGQSISPQELETEAEIAILESISMLQGLNLLPILPKWMRSPVGRAISPFKPFLTRSVEWAAVRYNDPKWWFKYGTYLLAMGGPRVFLKMLQGFPFLEAIAAFIGVDSLYERADEYLLRKSGGTTSLTKLISGLPGLFGKDISSQVAIQLPLTFNELVMGVVIATSQNIWSGIVKPVLDKDLNKAAEIKRGVQTTVPAVRDVWDAIDSYTDKEGWVYDDDGNKKYNMNSNWDRAMNAVGIRPIDKVYQDTSHRLARAERNFENRKIDDVLSYFINMSRRHHGEIPPAIMQKIDERINEFYIKPESFISRLKESHLNPAQREYFMSKIRDKEIIFRRYEEAGKNIGTNFLSQ